MLHIVKVQELVFMHNNLFKTLITTGIRNINIEKDKKTLFVHETIDDTAHRHTQTRTYITSNVIFSRYVYLKQTKLFFILNIVYYKYRPQYLTIHVEENEISDRVLICVLFCKKNHPLIQNGLVHSATETEHTSQVYIQSLRQ